MSIMSVSCAILAKNLTSSKVLSDPVQLIIDGEPQSVHWGERGSDFNTNNKFYDI